MPAHQPRHLLGQVGEVEEAAGAPAAGRLERGEVGEERQVAEMRPGMERDPGRHVRRDDGLGDRRRIPGRGERIGRIVGEADAAARPGALVVGHGEVGGVDRHRLDLHHRRAEREAERQDEDGAVLSDQIREELRQARKTHRRRLRHHGDALHHHAVDKRQHGLGRVGGEAGKGLRAGDQPDRAGHGDLPWRWRLTSRLSGGSSSEAIITNRVLADSSQFLSARHVPSAAKPRAAPPPRSRKDAADQAGRR